MAKKIILTQDVTGLGVAGDVVEVKPGYARNYLIPTGKATGWTRGGEKQVTSIRAARKSRELATIEEAEHLKERLESVAITLTAKAGAAGRLFGTVKPTDVADAVVAAGIGQIDKRKVEIASPIKSVGEHKATVRVFEDVVANITIKVVAA